MASSVLISAFLGILLFVSPFGNVVGQECLVEGEDCEDFDSECCDGLECDSVKQEADEDVEAEELMLCVDKGNSNPNQGKEYGLDADIPHAYNRNSYGSNTFDQQLDNGYGGNSNDANAYNLQSRGGANAFIQPPPGGPNAFMQPPPGGPNAFMQPSQGGVNAFMQPPPREANAFMQPPPRGANAFMQPPLRGANAFMQPPPGGPNAFMQPSQGGANSFMRPPPGGANSFTPQSNYMNAFNPNDYIQDDKYAANMNRWLQMGQMTRRAGVLH